jgi:hypothetical protein
LPISTLSALSKIAIDLSELKSCVFMKVAIKNVHCYGIARSHSLHSKTIIAIYILDIPKIYQSYETPFQSAPLDI